MNSPTIAIIIIYRPCACISAVRARRLSTYEHASVSMRALLLVWWSDLLLLMSLASLERDLIIVSYFVFSEFNSFSFSLKLLFSLKKTSSWVWRESAIWKCVKVKWQFRSYKHPNIAIKMVIKWLIVGIVVHFNLHFYSL